MNLTVAAVRWQRRGRMRTGVASTFLADRAGPGAALPVFVQKAHGFHLPADTNAPIVMVAEKAAALITGRNLRGRHGG